MPGGSSGRDPVAVTPSPINGKPVCPRMAIAMVDRHAIEVKPTTHGFRRCVSSEIAPKTGIETTTRADAIPFTTAYRPFAWPRSATTHAAKQTVAILIHDTVVV